MAGQRALISGRGVVASIAPGLSMVLESIDKFLSHMSLFTISAMHFRTSVQRLICRIFFCIPSYQARPYSELTGSLFTPPTPLPCTRFPHAIYQSWSFLHWAGRTGRTGRRPETNESGRRCLMFFLFYPLLIYIVHHGFHSTGFFGLLVLLRYQHRVFHSF